MSPTRPAPEAPRTPATASAPERPSTPEAMTPAYAAARAEEQGEAPQRRATPADAFHVARRHFLAGDRVDMQSLAAELGVSRGTLYRWTGDRERLLGDVMSSVTQASIERAKAEATGTGAERILGILDGVFHRVVTSDFFLKFLENESAVALRLITGREAGVQARFVQAMEAIIREEEDKGDFTSPVDANTLAYAIARLMEAFLYNDTLTGLEPQPAQARAVFALLLRP